MDSRGLGRTPTEVGAFFTTTWHMYQKILQHNHMHHRELYGLVRAEIAQLPPSLEILDLGCGDASYTAQALRGFQFQHYVGVDLSPIALSIAAVNFADVLGPHQFITANFVDYVRDCSQTFDFILMSFSLHHLSYGAKDEFLGDLMRCLRPGGVFLLIDVFRLESEGLEAYYDRYIGQAHRNNWQLDATDFQALTDHITTSDLPDSVATLGQLGQKHGFKPMEQLFLHPETTIGLLKFQA